MGSITRLLRRDWPKTRAHSMHDIGPCPDCGHLVDRWNRDAAQHWHQETDDAIFGEEVPELQGYVVGEGRTEETIDYYAEDQKR